MIISIFLYAYGRSLRVIMGRVLDCGPEVSEFELHLCYNVHFWTNALRKDMNPIIRPAVG